MTDVPGEGSHEQEQQRLLTIVRGWRPSVFPEYRGFRCAFCQALVDEAWHHWLHADGYHVPVHLCAARCEPLFQAGALPLSQEQSAAGARPIASNVYPFSEEAIRRFREIVSAWPSDTAPERRAFICDACGGELALEAGLDGSQHRQGYHVWWKMDPGDTLAELHFHRACGHSLGIYSQAEIGAQHGQGISAQQVDTSAAPSSPALEFQTFELPTGERALVPRDLELKLPEHTALAAEQLHFLVFVPWSDHYLNRVAEQYRDFFTFVLPYLHTRTTDVHIAACFPFASELIQATGVEVDSRVVHLAFILHDVGWSQLSEEEIAASLSTSGVTLTKTAMGPKEKHAVVGRDLAQQLLARYPFEPPLTETQKAWIAQAVLYHDKPWELAEQGGLPLEIKLVCDVDHLWSLTHENFWQDTIRKGVDPSVYLSNLEQDLETYFVTEPGKYKARRLLLERQAEVSAWARAKAALEAGVDATG